MNPPMKKRSLVVSATNLKINRLMINRLLTICILILALLIPHQTGRAQTAIEINDLAAFYKYGEQATFQAEVQPAAQVKELFLVIQLQGQPLILEKISLDKSGEVIFTYDLHKNPIQPFSRVIYWLQGQTTTGSAFESSHEFFLYEENLSEWKRLEEDRFVVSWHFGDEAFGRSALNAARAGLLSVSTYLPLIAPPSIRIYIYKSARDLQAALLSSPNAWVMGHTNPELKVILVSIPQDSAPQSEMERQIPHEIAHVIIYQLAGNSGYSRLPTWLSEGLASQAELIPNADYAKALESAARSNQLLSIESLCNSFPTNASAAYLAYAQSASFVQFYFKQFGSSGLINLISQYQQTTNCVEGVQAASGTSLETLEARWRQSTLGISSSTLVFQELSPFLIIGAILFLVPLSTILIVFLRRRR